MASRKVKCALAAALLLIAAAEASAYSRIISLYSGHIDNIIALGGEGTLIALPKNDEPRRLENLPRVPQKPGAETIIALRPDLVIMRTMNEKQNPGLSDVLKRAGIEVRLIDPPSWDGFEAYLRGLAPLIGTEPEEAAKKFADACSVISREAQNLKGEAPSPKVFVEATAKELHTCAPDSWAAHLIALCGGENAAASATPNRKGSAVAPWGLERTMRTATELDVYLVQHGAMNRSTPEETASRPWASVLKGVRIAAIPEYELSRPSLLGLENGCGKLMEIFYKDGK